MSRLLSLTGDIPGVFTDGEHLLTVNATPGKTVYGERLISVEGVEYRIWNPSRSKLAASIMLGGNGFGMDQSTKVLYLGAASGTTASHISDIVVNGMVHCIEISERSFRDLVKVCETRRNMIPILEDANRPEEYAHMIEGIELVYQDIAQRNQVDIFVRNMAAFDAGHGVLMLKSRSINVNRSPKDIFSEARRALVAKNLTVRAVIDLERYSKDHACFIVEA
ncbi:MAG: fibrillarin [Euryarchaeota archaeon RBG_19FT_COMBO_56_21]|nr:MAG: fibrillarin [Euryarchaeota archaeon RBG_19FT_COMBO_56_21]